MYRNVHLQKRAGKKITRRKCKKNVDTWKIKGAVVSQSTLNATSRKDSWKILNGPVYMGE